VKRPDSLSTLAVVGPKGGAVHGLTRTLVYPALLVAVLVAAIVLRLAVYVADRSLVIDEAFVALNVSRRSAAGLTSELSWNSAAPIGFLELEKGLTALFGSSEHVLRAAPFVASVAAVLLFVALAQRLLDRYAATLAVALFAGVALATSYAAIVKPYAFDVAFVIVLYLATLAVLRDERARWRAGALTLAGIVSPLFSYASVFVVAACAAVLVLDAVVRQSRTRQIRAFAVVCTWLLVLATMFAVHSSTLSHLRQSLSRENLNSLTSARNAVGAVRQLLGVSQYTNDLGAAFAFAAAAAAALLIVAGIFGLARTAWQSALLLLLPPAFVLGASTAGWYPMLPRTLLFLAPTLVLLMAAGCRVLLDLRPGMPAGALVLLLLTLVFTSEAASTVRALQAVRPDDGVKPIMATLAERQRPGDTVYLSYAAQYPFAYYLHCKCAGPRIARAVDERLWKVKPVSGGVAQWSPALSSSTRRFRIGVFRGYDPGYLNQDLRALPRGRVWVVLAGASAEQSRAVVARLDRRGRRLWTFHNTGGATTVSGYLYKF
jgi:hypothetical protein